MIDKSQQIAFFRQIRDRLVNLRRLLTAGNLHNLAQSFDICRELNRYNITLSEYALRHEIIMIINQLTAVTQIINDPETGDSTPAQEAVKSIITKITEALTILISETDKELRRNNASPGEKRTIITRSEVENPFEALANLLDKKEKSIKLVGMNTELTFKESINLLNAYSKKIKEIPTEVSEPFVIFQAPLLLHMHVNLERLKFINETFINTKVGYNDNWILEDAWIAATQDIATLDKAAALLSDRLKTTYIATHAQWKAWRLPGSPLLYSWLMNLETYKNLQPKIYSLSFPLEQEIKTPASRIKQQAAKRLALESQIQEDHDALQGVDMVYQSLLRERRSLEADIKEHETQIEDLRRQIDICEGVRARIDLRQKIVKVTAEIGDIKNKIKDIRQQIDIVRSDRSNMATVMPQREEKLREKLL